MRTNSRGRVHKWAERPLFLLPIFRGLKGRWGISLSMKGDALPIGSEKPCRPEGIQEASFVAQKLHQNRCLRLTSLRGLANLPFSPSGQSAAPKFERAGPSEFLFHPVLFFGARSSAARTKEKARSGPAGIRTPVPGSEGRKDIQTTLQAHENEYAMD